MAIPLKPYLLLLLLLLFLFVPSSLSSSAHPAYPDPSSSSSSSSPSSSSSSPSSSSPSSSSSSCSGPYTGDDLVPIRGEEYDGGRILDITYALREDMPSWESPDGLGPFLWLSASMANGSLANTSEMKLPTHTGTHVDAPGHVFQHYYEAGFDVDTLDLEVLNGSLGIRNVDFEVL